ncbi:MAG: hypothetical protein DRO67_00175 [Candidatus Asgardarchaeum californiense]|nr:MAG: hypothetical protein DRO67_00175 [Candidatus Asgardarchaeum californiense]
MSELGRIERYTLYKGIMFSKIGEKAGIYFYENAYEDVILLTDKAGDVIAKIYADAAQNCVYLKLKL